MSNIRCEYLGWKQPAVRSAAEYLLKHHQRDGLVDLTKVTIVTPTQRAGRRLCEVLLELAAERELAVFPPQTVTTSALPELLYEQKLPFAHTLVQQFAWADALKKVGRKVLKEIMPRHPEEDSDPRWLELGALLRRQHIELADHRLDFAAVAKRGKTLEGFTDFARWTALAKVQKLYLASLDALELWDRPTARNYTIKNKECCLDGHVVLFGTVNLTETIRGMMAQIGDQVTALVFAERHHADRFDEFGCVVPEAWQNSISGVDDHHILVADGPANQADAVVYAIDKFDGQYSADDITIGVPDESLVPHIENKLSQFRIDVRWGPGRSLSASSPAHWLRIAADYLATEQYSAFAELIRHPDTHQYLSGLEYRHDVVKEFDRYFDEHLPDQLCADKSHAGELPDAAWLLFDLLKGLRGEPDSPKVWAEAIYDVVLRLYDRRQLNVDNPYERATVAACERIGQTQERFASLPDELTPRVSASAAILMMLDQIADDEVAPAHSPNAIEMVGWLDLPLDDAKVAIVTNMNDGVVPRSVSSDVFLPNRFREALGLDDNARRYARDAYALQTLLNSRMVVRLIVGRRAATNDPLRPSRLLMATQRDKLPQRCLRLFNSKTDCEPIVMPVDHDELRFKVPRPEKLHTPINGMSVTAFATYLRCPYRFYLEKAQRIRNINDDDNELDGSKFGNLAHDVLEAFGNSEFRDSSNESEIRLYLAEQLATMARDKYGVQPMPTIQVQLAQLRLRLETFAEKQAEWRQEGWRILKTEQKVEDAAINVDGEDFLLNGRIDRIDRREIGGVVEIAVLDYKAGDAGDAPRKKHISGVRKGEPVMPENWVELQLPLYRHLLKRVDDLPDLQDAQIRLGYVLLPSTASDTRFEIAEWSSDELGTADIATEDVIRNVRKEVFWPPTDPYPFKDFDDHAAVVQNGVFGREPFVDAEEAVA